MRATLQVSANGSVNTATYTLYAKDLALALSFKHRENAKTAAILAK